MRITEQQLLTLLTVVRQVIDDTIQEELAQPGVRDALSSMYNEILIQQNEIVDTSNYDNPTRDQILRLALDMFEAFEVTADKPEDFYQSPLGKRAHPLLYPELAKRRLQRDGSAVSDIRRTQRPEKEEDPVRSHVLVVEELAIANSVLERHRRFLDNLRGWTTTFGVELCPPSHCTDTFGEGVREMKAAVWRMLQEMEDV